MTYKLILPTRTIIVVTIALISTFVFTSALSVSNTDARNMGPQVCKAPKNGVVECCAVDLDTSKTWCTWCNDTDPPSGCIPPLDMGRGDDIDNPNVGGVFTPDDSDISNEIDRDNITTGGVFSTDDSDSETSSDSRAEIDSSEINSGGTFN
jgi:hypothetical protein